jgi:hypothetical protein
VLLALAWLAAAAIPDDVRPVASPVDVQAQLDRWRAAQDQEPAVLACAPLWPEQAQLCFRRGASATAYVTVADLKAWKVDLDGLVAELRRRSEPKVEAQLRAIDIDGTTARYWIATGDDGWASALLLHPGAVSAKVGSPLLVAVPAEGIVVAWRGGEADIDKIVTVGVTQIHASRPGSITAVVHRWTGSEWVQWAEAVKSKVASP